MLERPILFVGNTAHPEFRGTVRWLERRGPLAVAVDIPQACHWLGVRRMPARLVLLAQSVPGQFTTRDVERIHSAAPLARTILLLGSWCDGETCSGRPVPGSIRLFWHDAVPQLESELAKAGRTGGKWSLPRTATQAELLDLTCRPIRNRQTGLVIVAARSQTTYEGLGDALLQAGYASSWLRPDGAHFTHGAALAVWDDSSRDAGPPLSLAEFSKRMSGTPVIALLSFPRQGDLRRAHAEGAAAILAKPFSLESLLAQLRGVRGEPTFATGKGAA
jgi:hypothetical protein